MNQTQIQLTVEEGMKFQTMDAELRGFVEGMNAGAQAMADRIKRGFLNDLLASRTAAPKEDSNGGN